MKNPITEHAIGIPIMTSASYSIGTSLRKGPYLLEPANHCHNEPPKFKQCKENSVMNRMNKLGKKAEKLANEVREHVRLGSRISDTVKGKLSLGARIIQVGGVEKVFKQLFSVRQGEKLYKAYQCYLSTTAGPIAGLLFISTDKIAFCSDKSIKFSSPNGVSVRIHYKVLIPMRKINRVNRSENEKKPSQKYLELVTMDNYDFWFMGFLNYEKAFKCLQQALSQD